VDQKAEELAAVIEEIRARVRSRFPNGTLLGDVPLPDLTPLLHARDAAEAKVASIGSVNPRAPGLVNSTIQAVKRTVARALDWHIREQVEFNRGVMSCVQATLEALNECNRTMTSLAGKIEAVAKYRDDINPRIDDINRRIDETAGQITQVHQHAERHIDEVHSHHEALHAAIYKEFTDVRSHWHQWREGWDHKLATHEMHFLRSIAELQASFQQRVNLLEESYRDMLTAQHADFEGALARENVEIQRKLWADLDRIRTEYETIIHAELRILRQKAALAPAPTATAASGPTALDRIDWLKFAEKFRGAEQYVKDHQHMYAERFAGLSDVLDIGCGRGELLAVFQQFGIQARGIDTNAECVALCRSKDLNAEQADMFGYLDSLPDASLGGVVCSQVVEHLPPERIPELVHLAHAKIRRDGLFAVETPNPECLAIFATHFYLDPTHNRPIPPPLMAFYCEEAGFGRIEVERLYPAVETMPSLGELPEAFRKEFFGSLDYALFGRKLG